MSIYDILIEEVATREKAFDFAGMIGLLPDPDPILRKLNGGYSVLEDLTADGRVISAMQQRKLGTLKKEFLITNPEGSPEKIKNMFLEDLENIKMQDVINGILDAPYYGIAPLELLWEAKGGNIRLKDIRTLPARWFGFDEENKIRFRTFEAPDEGIELPYGKFVVTRHFPTYDNPYGLRLLSRVFWPVTFKKGGIKFWVKFMEKFGIPFVIGKYRPGATKDEKEELRDKLYSMVQDAVAVIPEGNAVEILEVKSQAAGMLFEKFKKEMDNEISIAILGQNLTTEVKGGSYAAGKVHENILKDLQEADQKLVKDSMDEILKVYTELNAGKEVTPPEFKWFDEEDLQTERAKRDGELSKNIKFTKQYYIKHYGFDEEDFEVIDNVKAQNNFTEFQQKHKKEQIEEFEDFVIGEVEGLPLDNFLKVFEQSKDFEEALSKLHEIYKEIDIKKLEKMLEKAIFTSESFGMIEQ
jgi:phage gp29-like protein